MACTDPVSDIVDIVSAVLGEAFDPASECPPTGGGSTTVRFFAGEGAPLVAWEAHAAAGCEEPFLWVRVMQRFRSETFPEPAIDSNCILPRVAAIELGVGRCAVMDSQPSWEDYAVEAEISLDDSWRIELALCTVATRLRGLDYPTAIGDLTPYGPEGGIVAWNGVLYVQFG